MFQPGQSGNPSGKKPGTKNRFTHEKEMAKIAQHSEELLDSAIRAGKHDGQVALELLRIWREDQAGQPSHMHTIDLKQFLSRDLAYQSPQPGSTFASVLKFILVAESTDLGDQLQEIADHNRAVNEADPEYWAKKDAASQKSQDRLKADLALEENRLADVEAKKAARKKAALARIEAAKAKGIDPADISK